MTLAEAIKKLQTRKDIAVALDLGLHQSCLMDSNCPVAIRLRSIMSQAGISLEELESEQEVLEISSPSNIQELEGSFEPDEDMQLETTVDILGQQLKIDLMPFLQDRMRDALLSEREDSTKRKKDLQRLGEALFTTYKREIWKIREGYLLPQLAIPYTALLENDCVVTSNGKYYLFVFRTVYNPKWLVSNGIRYALAASDEEGIRREPVYLEFISRQDWTFYGTPNLYLPSGTKLRHYHGSVNWDCWGQVPFPSAWDGELQSLAKLKDALMRALATINYDNLLEKEPVGFPPAKELLDRATLLGREGEITGVTQERTTPRGWGRTRTGWRGRND